MSCIRISPLPHPLVGCRKAVGGKEKGFFTSKTNLLIYSSFAFTLKCFLRASEQRPWVAATLARRGTEPQPAPLPVRKPHPGAV